MWSPVASLLRSRLTRRGLLALGIGFGLSALALGGLAGALLRTRPPGAGRALLSDDEARFLEALAEAYLPPGNAFGVSAGELAVSSTLDGFFERLLPRERRLFRGLLMAFENWPRLSFSSARRFSELSLEERIALLRDWEESDLDTRRQIASLVRILVGFVVFEDARVLAAMGARWGCGPSLPVADPHPVHP